MASQVQRVVADDVVVVLEVGEHLLVAVLAVRSERKRSADLDRIAGPVERRSPCAAAARGCR